jgi:DNA-binding response OmpR family regulator
MTLTDATADEEELTDASLPIEQSRILVVDDDAHAAVLMRRLIEREGFSTVETANDGRCALAMMAHHPPDVVVLDVHLPEVGGFEVLRQIVRSDERTGRATGVLGVSGDPTDSTAESMLWAGADDFMPRPFEGPEFMARVRRLANRTRSLPRPRVFALPRTLRPRPFAPVTAASVVPTAHRWAQRSEGTRTTLRPPEASMPPSPSALVSAARRRKCIDEMSLAAYRPARS